jgi:DNA adenine methylase
VLRYHGGKYRLAPWILSFFPKHAVYVEPYGGAASVLMQKVPVKAECYNDLDGQVVNVFRVLRDPVSAAELRRRVQLTPFARDELDWSYAEATDPIDAAHKLIIRSFMGHGTDGATRGCRTGFRSKLTDGRSLPSAEWASWSDAIPTFTARLASVTIENRDALEVIARMDHRKALFYVDPPYVHSARTAVMSKSSGSLGYRHEMVDAQHQLLAETLRRVKGMVVLNGYPTALYDEHLYADWERHEKQSVIDGNRKRTEVVWLNKACAEALARDQSQQPLFAHEPELARRGPHPASISA